jgi:hypothetical protein
MKERRLRIVARVLGVATAILAITNLKLCHSLVLERKDRYFWMDRGLQLAKEKVQLEKYNAYLEKEKDFWMNCVSEEEDKVASLRAYLSSLKEQLEQAEEREKELSEDLKEKQEEANLWQKYAQVTENEADLAEYLADLRQQINQLDREDLGSCNYTSSRNSNHHGSGGTWQHSFGNTTFGNVGGKDVWLHSSGNTIFGDVGGKDVWLYRSGNTIFGDVGGDDVWLHSIGH